MGIQYCVEFRQEQCGFESEPHGECAASLFEVHVADVQRLFILMNEFVDFIHVDVSVLLLGFAEAVQEFQEAAFDVAFGDLLSDPEVQFPPGLLRVDETSVVLLFFVLFRLFVETLTTTVVLVAVILRDVVVHVRLFL
jgi:hypothetical protein